MYILSNFHSNYLYYFELLPLPLRFVNFPFEWLRKNCTPELETKKNKNHIKLVRFVWGQVYKRITKEMFQIKRLFQLPELGRYNLPNTIFPSAIKSSC